MKYFQRFFFMMISMFFLCSVYAQKRDSVNDGYAEGVVKGAAEKHSLQVATISVYKASDSSLVSYQLTNSYGGFRFRTLPVAEGLEIVVSHIGYKNFHRKFLITGDLKKIDLGDIFLEQGEIQLNEVIVKYRRPPVQMNGDTLEFNAEAFKLDRNAAVEDLLRKLPGVTIWADGKITINGKTVKDVLVDGKPFFGPDGKVAIQNLPKDAVNKIQVFNKRDEQKSPLDSILSVNIVLNKNKRKGLFGKLGAGYGTDKRYSGDAAISIFSPLTQLSVAGAANNTNVTANDVGTLLKNGSFKGVGVNLEYQPDFEMEGLNRSASGGFDYLHYFIPDAGYTKNNHLGANYFINNRNTDISRNTQTVINLNEGESLVQTNNSTSNIQYTTQKFDVSYVLQNERLEFYALQTLGWNTGHNYAKSTNTSGINFQEFQSVSKNIYDQDIDNQNILFRTGIKNKVKFYKINYVFTLNKDVNKHNTQIDFYSPINPSLNQNFNRNYDPHAQSISHEVEFKYDDLKRLLLGEKEFFKIGIGVLNTIKINNDHSTNTVTDLDTITRKDIVNSYLTNTYQYNTIDERPGLKLERTFIQFLTDRYKKTIFLYAEGREQFFSQKNVSGKSFQNFNRSYSNFIPKASINYLNDQFGDHQLTYELSFNSSVIYPTSDQIAPLIDSVNIYYQQRGNQGVKPSYKRELSMSVTYVNFRSKGFADNYNVNLRAGYTSNAIVDSTIYDDIGRTVNYSVNMNGSKYLTLNAEFHKALKFKENQFQISSSTATNLTKQPGYINSVFNISNNIYSDNGIGLLYSLRDFFALEIKEKLILFRSRQTGLENNVFKSTIQKTILSASLNLLKRVTINSNVSLTRNTSTYSPARTFTVWNAGTSYRFLKGNQAEVKISALDLLHQNTNIINYGYNNILTTGSVNVLKQYFMVSFSYFPRIFGTKGT
jgi:hypothetical protein